MAASAILNLFESKIAPLDPPSPKTPPYKQEVDRTTGCGDMAIWKFSKMAAAAILDFVQTGKSAIKSAVPENLTLEQNMKWIGRPVADISPFATWNFSNMAVAAILDLFEP